MCCADDNLHTVKLILQSVESNLWTWIHSARLRQNQGLQMIQQVRSTSNIKRQKIILQGGYPNDVSEVSFKMADAWKIRRWSPTGRGDPFNSPRRFHSPALSFRLWSCNHVFPFKRRELDRFIWFWLKVATNGMNVSIMEVLNVFLYDIFLF